MAAFSFLQQRQQDPVLHDILGGFDSDPYMLVSLIQLVHMGVHIADVLVYERDVSILRLYISCQWILVSAGGSEPSQGLKKAWESILILVQHG